MSKGKENPETVRRRNAQPERMRQRSAQGNQWQILNPERARENAKKSREGRGTRQGVFAEMIEKARTPIVVRSDNVALTSDWHIPFHDDDLVEKLFADAEEHGTKDIVIAGDFWDCDNVSKFNSITEADISTKMTFKGEQEEVKKMLKRVLNVFDQVYICRGNHEKRWCDLNAGAVGLKQLFEMALPGIEDGKYADRVHITSDDHLHIVQAGQEWLACHPRNFRITPLSVARDLAAKHHCNVFMAHGHGFNQGRDRSGKYICLDGGGLFDRESLEYTRETTCHPATRSGYYILEEGKLHVFEGSGMGNAGGIPV